MIYNIYKDKQHTIVCWSTKDIYQAKKLSGVDIQRQLRHKNATKTEHNPQGLGNERNALNGTEKIQGYPKSKIVGCAFNISFIWIIGYGVI